MLKLQSGMDISNYIRLCLTLTLLNLITTFIYTVTNLRLKFSGQNISLQVDINVGFNKYLIIITGIYYYIIIFNYYFRVSFFCGWVGVYVRERGDIFGASSTLIIFTSIHSVFN